MGVKMRVKITIDFLMTVLLIVVMAYQVTGEMLHEVLGVSMILLFFAHNFLNFRWYACLFKGKYNPLRIFQTVVNFLLLFAMLSLAYSGVVISGHVFSFLPINGGMSFARILHLAASSWCLVLVGIHLGFHWGMMVGAFGRMLGGKNSPVLKWMVRLVAAAIAIYGGICFYKANIISYLFFRTHFAFLDYEKSALLVFAEYSVIMGMWVYISYYIVCGIKKRSGMQSSRKEQ